MNRYLPTIVLGAVLAVFCVGAAFAGEDAGAPLDPVVGETTENEFEYDETETAATETAEDAPLAPAESGRRGFKYGAILEYWLLDPGVKFTRMPSGPSLTGMVDDSKQYFMGNAVLRDAELKRYSARQGVLQWTTYFWAKKAGQHVFLISLDGVGDSEADFAGAALLINDEVKVLASGDNEASGYAEFSAPGLYKLQVRLWWTHETKANYQDMSVSLKVREPGSLSLRQAVRKDLFYKLP